MELKQVGYLLGDAHDGKVDIKMTGNARSQGKKVLEQWGEVKEQQKAFAKFEKILNRNFKSAVVKKAPVKKKK